MKKLLLGLLIFISFGICAMQHADDDDGETPLHNICAVGDAQEVQEILDTGADVTARDADGDTPLHTACHYGNVQAVQTLLHCADVLGGIQVLNNEGYTPLHYAAGAGYTAIVRELLAHGADSNATERSRTTPLVYAVQSNAPIALIEALLAHQADPDVLDVHGNNALAYAAGDEQVQTALMRAMHR